MVKKEFRGLLVDNFEDANIVFYGVPFDQNCSIGSGSNKAPDKIRELSWWLPPYSMDGEPLNHIKIFDAGDIPCCSFNDIYNNSDIFNDKKIKFLVGGDHSISISFQKNFIESSLKKGKKPVIVHIDAHCDICDIYLDSKYSHACTVRRALDNGLEEDNLFMIGIREFEKDGYDYLVNRKNNVHLFKASDIFDTGLNSFFDEINKKASDDYCVYISFDIDSLDSGYAPGTGTPETCGLTPMTIRKILRHLAKFKNIKCIDLVEIAPPLDVNDVTSWCGLKLIYEFLSVLRVQ